METDSMKLVDTRAWLSKSVADLRAAHIGLNADPPTTADTTFHAQQAVEKSLKALLTWHDVPFRKTHNLVELGEQCVSLAPQLEELLRRAAMLSEYAWKFRYPTDEADPTVQEATEALTLAREVYDSILGRLPDEAKP